LAGKGFGITLISFEKPSFAEATEDKKPTAEGQQLNAIQLNYHKSPPVISTLYDIYLLKKAVKKALKSQQIDIIHCRSYVTSLVGCWAKRKYGVKFIFDMRGFWADERVEGGLWNLSNPVFKAVYRYFKRKEKEFLLESDATISLTYNAKNEIEKNILAKPLIHQAANPPINIEVIPTCADLDLFDPKKVSFEVSQELREKLGIGQDDFVLLYLGSLGTWYMLEEMIDFFKELKGKGLPAGKAGSNSEGKYKFLFLTKEQNEVKQAINRRNLDDTDFIVTSCVRAEVPKYISICNASIFLIIPTYSKKASAATKMGEIMAMGKPVITNAGWGDVEEIIPISGAGVLVSELSANGYQEAISQLHNSNFDAQNIRRQATELFSLQKGIDQYAEIYQQLVSD
jgi:glycosyltransferase involved in cell wall biosynthesis